LDGVEAPSVDLQLSLLFEELTEAINGLESRNATELLDGAVDCYVVVVGLLEKLQQMGFKVEQAIERIGENNMSKFPKVKPGNVPTGHSVVFVPGHDVYVIRNSAGKIMKPEGFVPVSLDDLVPDNVFGEKE
jgi:NTP pyrophosphatase (non-canonical NTP hydrolase)